MLKSKDMNEILATVEEQYLKPNISPIKIFQPNVMMSAVIENVDDGENNPRYSSECDTLRSSNQFQKEVDQALEKA